MHLRVTMIVLGFVTLAASCGGSTAAEAEGQLEPPVTTGISLAESIPISVIAVRSNNPSVVILDLAAMTETRHPPGSHALPTDAVDGAVVTPDGALIIWTQGRARQLSLADLSVVQRELGTRPPRLIEGVAPALRVMPSPDGTRIWLIQPGFAGYPTLIELIDTETGRQLLLMELDPEAFPVGATDRGLVLNIEDAQQPGRGGVVHLLTDGSTLDIGQGHAIATGSEMIILLVCPDTEPGCDAPSELVVVGPDGNERLAIPRPSVGAWVTPGEPVIPSDSTPLTTISPDGSQLLIAVVDASTATETGMASTLVAVNLHDGSISALGTYIWPGWQATWSRDGRWIVVLDHRDIELIEFMDLGATRFTISDAIPENHFPFAAG